ncbi:MAG: hypothetical protein Q9162_007116 [Coniocarpon cinnabarinum]
MYVSPSEVHVDPAAESDARDSSAIEGFLALHFPDCTYYVNENPIILGRDTRLQEFLENHTDIRVTTSHPTYQPPTREEYDRDFAERIADAPGSDEESFDGEDFAPTEPRYASLEGGIATFDINLQQTIGRQNEAFLAIHPPGDSETGRFPRITAISKQHLRLYANNDDDCWMVEILGRNGAFVDDEYYEAGSHVTLEHMSNIGVADLNFKVAYGDVSDSELEDSDDESLEAETSSSIAEESETSPEPVVTQNGRKVRVSRSSNDSDEEEEEEIDLPETKAKPAKPTTKLKLKVSSAKSPEKPTKDSKDVTSPKDKIRPKAKETSEEAQKKIMSLLQPGEEPGRRKGPGRPPANGLMSKREMKERQKALADAQKRGKEGSSGDLVSPIANINGSSSKDDAEERSTSKKRKRSNTNGDSKLENSDKKKRPSPEKSPSPTEDQFTPDQLQPPGLTYVVIIYRILQDVAPRQLNLQQLYREMKKRYPYYRFRPKPGWESSVRHTVSAQNFIKGEKDGKGYKYTFNPNEPPAPQKQKQVTTAPSQQTGYPTGLNPRPVAGQYPPGTYTPYGYPNAYQQGPPQQNVYGQNIPMHHQRPLTNGNVASSQNQPLPNNTLSMPPARNPQNSPYPINPTVPGLNSAQHQAPTAPPTGNPSTPTNQALASSHPAPQIQAGATQSIAAGQPSQSISQPGQAASTGQGEPQSSRLHQSSDASSRPHGQASQTATPVQANGLSRPPSTTAPLNTAVQTPHVTQPHQPSQPSSQSASTPTSANRPKTPYIPTASEELAQGRLPHCLISFEANMKRLCSNMPQRQQDIETQALDQAIRWIRDHPTGDFTPEPGMSTYTVSVISNMKTLIAKQDSETMRARQASGGTDPAASTGR